MQLKGLTHKEENPNVKPSAAATWAGPWTFVGTMLGIVVQVSQLGAAIPEEWRGYVAFAGALAGLLLQAFFGKPAYVEAPPKPPPTEVEALKEQVAKLEKMIAEMPKTPSSPPPVQ